MLGWVEAYGKGRSRRWKTREAERGVHVRGGVGKPVLGELSVNGIPPHIPWPCEVVADLRELLDAYLIPILLELLQRDRPELPE